MSNGKEQGPNLRLVGTEGAELRNLDEARREARERIMERLYDAQEDFMDAIAAPRLRELGERDEELQKESFRLIQKMHGIAGLVLDVAGISNEEWREFRTRGLREELATLDGDHEDE